MIPNGLPNLINTNRESKLEIITHPKDSTPYKRVFFIVGCGRSGTSLLQSMLSSNKSVAIPPETGFYSILYERYKKKLGELEAEESFDEAVDAALGFWRIASLELKKKEIIEAKDDAWGLSWESLLLSILSGYGKRTGATYLGEKSPHHVEYLPRIFTKLPGAKVIHIVRDPRAVYLSFTKVGAGFGRKYSADVCSQWLSAVRAHWEALKRGADDQYKLVRYEDLIKSPEMVLLEVCTFLGIDYDIGMMEFYKESHNTYHLNQSDHMKNTKKPIFSDSIDKWKYELPAYQLKIIEHRLGRDMALLGYDRHTNNKDITIFLLDVFDKLMSLYEKSCKKLKAILRKEK